MESDANGNESPTEVTQVHSHATKIPDRVAIFGYLSDHRNTKCVPGGELEVGRTLVCRATPSGLTPQAAAARDAPGRS
jgi:hypothetical protein